MIELKPCPFCGAPAVHWEWNGGARVDCSKWASDGTAVNVHFVGIGARTFEEAAKLWNERKDEYDRGWKEGREALRGEV